MNEGRLSSVQIIRGIAACLVVFLHASSQTRHGVLGGWPVWGLAGVDFFFVLSGFVITYISIDHFGDKKYFSYFLSRRLLRIYPIHWFFAILFLLLLPAMTSEKALDLPGIVQSMLLYPLPQRHHVNSVTWTLSHEIIFYSIFASAFWLRRNYFLALLGVWTSSILLFSYWKFSNNYALITVLSRMNYEFLYGCAVAFMIRKGYYPRGRIFAIAAIAAGVSFLIGTRIANPEMTDVRFLVRLRHLYFGLPCAAILFGCVLLESGSRTRIKQFLLFIGDASYSIYLVHPLVIGLLMKRAKLGTFITDKHLIFALLASCSIAAGCLAYACVEKPLLKWLYSRSPWNKRALVESTPPAAPSALPETAS